jgi:integrase
MAFKVKRGKLSWQLQVYNGIDPTTGKKDYIKETFKAPKIDPETGKKITPAKAEKLADLRLSALETDLDRQEYINPLELTFYDFLVTRFLPSVEANDSEGAYEEYSGIVKNHIAKDPIGRLLLPKVELQHIDDYKIRKLKSPRLDGKIDHKTGKPKLLSPKTVKNHIIMIKSAFTYACKLRILKYNPSEYAEFPHVPKYKAKTWTEEQAQRFLDVAYWDRFYFLYLLGIFYSKRKGELRGIKMSDVDLNNLTMMIWRSVRGSGYSAQFKDTKTDETEQLLELEEWMVPFFKREITERAKEKLEYGPGYNDNELLFASYNGNPVKERTLDEHYKAIIKRAGIPEIRFHDLRHTCITIMLKRGWSLKHAQNRAAHADERTTANLYAHVTPAMQRDVNKDMTKALKPRLLKIDYQKDYQNKKPTG